ncbi:hypothetical protein TRFO_08432 [Tritrichomonas foetus]|uniref:Uncharacterized protein n=1 Tax=Tritrichomonas foetus TaxID=1144522 RepID=A0A1J4JM29_9EUKA|nr:hypothetical protein TRFO_08432 [Tritrichomonas foetus]|eukprot:OHS99479.1 hypothetical protein TRFO_08432 [Tritrichomonas foetus]
MEEKIITPKHISFDLPDDDPKDVLSINKSPRSDSSLSEIISIKTDQHAKLIAACRTKDYYNKKLERLNKQIIDLNQKGESTLSVLGKKKDELLTEKEQLTNNFYSKPSIDFLEEQYLILRDIERQQNYEIEDDNTFRKLGILDSSEDMSMLLKKLNDLLLIINPPHQKRIAQSPNEVILKRRYKVLKSTSRSSIQKATQERETLKREIQILREKLDHENERQILYQSFSS